MKKWMLLLLLPLLLLFGCSDQEDAQEGTQFWYLNSTYQYGTEASMFACEYRSIDNADLLPALANYLSGPTHTDKISPFPKDTAVLSCNTDNGILSVTLSREFLQASPAQISCASICLAKTGTALTGCATVQIFTEDNPDTAYLQLDHGDYMLYDDVITDVVNTPENEVTQ